MISDGFFVRHPWGSEYKLPLFHRQGKTKRRKVKTGAY
jgi:hypothetical protein